MKLQETLLAELNLEEAVANEVRRGVLAIPRQSLEAALTDEGVQGEAVGLLRARFPEGVDFGTADEVQASKPMGGFRTLDLLTFGHRVLYEALGLWLLQRRPELRRSFAKFLEVQEAPLESPDTKYVVMADVGSFYHYVDHRLLHAELVSQTGGAGMASVLSELLHETMGRQFGLPQLSTASDVFSELVIDIAERRLLRKGLRVWRFNDDFRIAANTWAEAQTGIAELVREVRTLGLTLNDAKTLTPGREKYQEWKDATEKTWEAVQQAVSFDLQQAKIIMYADEWEPDGDEDSVAVEAADRALDLWQEHHEHPDDDERASDHVYRELLTTALYIMRNAGDARGLRVCGSALGAERSITPQVARYLESLAPDGSVTELIEERVSRFYLTPWQELWLLSPLLAASELPSSVAEWASSRTSNQYPSILRARASLVLARHGLTGAANVASLYEELHPAANSDSVAALALLSGDSDPLLKAVAGETPFNRWIVDAVRADTWP
jgi:RNA-directed DNA polymerase